MAFLYVNTKGTPWRKHSYSAGSDFDLCPFKYFMRRVQGWKEKDNKARLLFGKAVESAVQFYHDHSGEGGREEFHRLWAPYKDRRDIEYTRTEKDWSTLDADGDDLLRLYAIRQPSLPIPLRGQLIFQREITKEVFPGDPNYGEIEDAGKLDIIAYVQPDHPLLPRLDWKPEYGMLRPLIIDMKTSGKDYPREQGIAAYDEQLRRYSWLSGIHDVAFLVFVKVGRKFQKGSSVTLLEDIPARSTLNDILDGQNHRAYKAGEEAVIAKVEGENCWLLANDYMLEQMDEAQGEKKDKHGVLKTDQTKEAKGRGQAWLKANGVLVHSGFLTRQRIQFNAGFVTTESQLDAGQACANQIVGIVNAWKSKKWPNKFGVRFPHNNLTDPYFRAFVLKDEAYQKENFIKSDEETIQDLFADESEDEE
jgi:hypothetical protein